MTCDIRVGRILGLPAIHGEKVVGHVEKAIPDGEGRHVQGFIIRRGLGGAKWIPVGNIAVLGDVSVILRERPGRVPRCCGEKLTSVKDEGGLTLGRVTDWWISPDGRDITALEVTLGLLEDLRSGRRTVRSWSVRPGEDGPTVLIPREEWE